jgi:hypothetical protein
MEDIGIMASISYEAVVQLVDQLSAREQQNLIAHLEAVSRQRELTFDEWRALLKASQLPGLPGPAFSDRRSDWYDDERC